ncbi:phosphotransferase family protein [Nocardioides campestrisoli]|uniref:phosphotransferase family protein n=1 Tax=Nocardioides campestrisoli TaxID=2736757 RepID=UPI00163D9AF1|nr:phosphotransferase family protein [Nocardioides campestrisoli]
MDTTASTSLHEGPALDLVTRLEDRLDALLGVGHRVTGLRRVSGGASRQTWALTVRSADGEEQGLVLRRDPPTEPRPEEMAREAIALRAARRHGVPGPDLVDAGTDTDVLGAPYLLMTFVPGETIARKILRDDRYAVARSRLAVDLGRAAAAIHQVPAEEVAGLPAHDVLEELRARYASTGVLRPVVELAFRWLEAHRPPPTLEPVLVHGDYRLGNVIVDERGLAAVLDWELVHVGDPMEDLGYLSIRAWRFGGPRPVAGVGGFDELFDAYEEAGGLRPEPEVVFWWQVAGTLSWAIGCLVQANRHFTGASRSVELAAIGRRTAEQEHDLLRMLHPRTATTRSR